MDASTVFAQLPHGARYVCVPGDFPTGESGSAAFRRSLVAYFTRDAEAAAHYKRRPLRTRGKSLRHILKTAIRVIEREGLVEEYAGFACELKYPSLRSPLIALLDSAWDELGFRNVAVYPVTGSNEGIYVHAGLTGLRADREAHKLNRTHNEFAHREIITVKLWHWETAWQVTRRLAELLGA